MNSPDTPRTPQQTSSARDFFLILICAIGLSIAFVQWMKSSVQTPPQGGLDVGLPAPELRASRWVNGDAPDPEKLQGQVYVVVAWATWCYPCLKEAPHLVEVYQDVHSQGVQFYGFAAQPETLQPEIEKWLADAQITWPNGYGQDAAETLLKFEADFIPGVWVVGKDGTIVWNRAQLGHESLSEAIERALAGE